MSANGSTAIETVAGTTGGGGALPPEGTDGVTELIAALSRTTYSFRGDRLLLEPKDQVKLRLGYSPDDADAFALTFAQPVVPARTWQAGGLLAAPAPYDRFAPAYRYDPFAPRTDGYDPLRPYRRS